MFSHWIIGVTECRQNFDILQIVERSLIPTNRGVWNSSSLIEVALPAIKDLIPRDTGRIGSMTLPAIQDHPTFLGK